MLKGYFHGIITLHLFYCFNVSMFKDGILNVNIQYLIHVSKTTHYATWKWIMSLLIIWPSYCPIVVTLWKMHQNISNKLYLHHCTTFFLNSATNLLQFKLILDRNKGRNPGKTSSLPYCLVSHGWGMVMFSLILLI